MAESSSVKQLNFLVAAVTCLIAGAAVLTGAVVIGNAHQDKIETELVAQSGSSDVPLEGTLETEEVRVVSATISVNAEFKETTMKIQVQRKSASGSHAPIFRVTTDKTVCQTPRSWMWSSNSINTLSMRCDTTLTKADLGDIGTGLVEVGT